MTEGGNYALSMDLVSIIIIIIITSSEYLNPGLRMFKNSVAVYLQSIAMAYWYL